VKKLLVPVVVAVAASVAAGRVWVSVYEHDGRTPLAMADVNHPDLYRDIMVGTRLTLVVRSDSGAYFVGKLLLSWDDAPYGTLSGRGYAPPAPGSPVKFGTYPGSTLDAAGTAAYVRDLVNVKGIGLELSSDQLPYFFGAHRAYPGDWFILDYRATQAGFCHVGLYDSSVSTETPIQRLAFRHVPSRDFNGDAVVDLKDFARLASHWRSPADPNSAGDAALDLTADGRVGPPDLASFSRFWLERTDSNEPPAPVAQP
jgi:hypothetical protein